MRLFQSSSAAWARRKLAFFWAMRSFLWASVSLARFHLPEKFKLAKTKPCTPIVCYIHGTSLEARANTCTVTKAKRYLLNSYCSTFTEKKKCKNTKHLRNFAKLKSSHLKIKSKGRWWPFQKYKNVDVSLNITRFVGFRHCISRHTISNLNFRQTTSSQYSLDFLNTQIFIIIQELQLMKWL